MALFIQSIEMPALLLAFLVIMWLWYLGMHPGTMQRTGTRVTSAYRETCAFVRTALLVASIRVTSALDAAGAFAVRVQMIGALTEDRDYDAPTIRFKLTESGPVTVPPSATHHQRHRGQMRFRDWLTEANGKHFAAMNEFTELKTRVDDHLAALRRASLHTEILRDMTVIRTQGADTVYPKLAALR